ncbi:MAG: HlyD family efflux transporter periplasmic adaptor subunit [Rhodospirillaceae bacterium]
MSWLHTLSGWLLALFTLVFGSGDGRVTLTGYAEADRVLVAPELAGRLINLNTARGSTVKAGEPLFSQDDTAERAVLAEARAQIAAAEARLANLLTGKRPEEVEVLAARHREAEARARLAEKQLERRTLLAAKRVASEQELDIARADLDAARAQVRSSAAEITVARLPARPEEVKAAESAVAVARAATDHAAWRLARRSVAAPVSARVEDVLHWPGEQVAAASPVVALLPPDTIKVRFYAPEHMIGRLHPGQPVGLACSGCAPGISGRISFIASAPEYTPPVIYSTTNRHTLVFLIEARPDHDPEQLHPGQPVDVTPELP